MVPCASWLHWLLYFLYRTPIAQLIKIQQKRNVVLKLPKVFPSASHTAIAFN
ncbi:hypothetical protein CK203_072704 [Vitis vinifera]|uniref:Uncharacterized protein n=1 Tax=Vitis vinifera TaxID=29760 RepID=A0A438EZ15_VITVI|nr:hypothetical protein CK203_072704 [Vitis vinifera]